MTSIPSATSWGSPTASKHALLVHGLASPFHTWQRIASGLAAKGYFVTVPNLTGHSLEVATDCRVSSIAEDLSPYLQARCYDLIIGHSLGALVVISIFPIPPFSTTIILVDPPLELATEEIPFFESMFTEIGANHTLADAHAAGKPLWKPDDCFDRGISPYRSSVGAAHKNWPCFFDYLKEMSKKRRVIALLVDPTIIKLCPVKDLKRYPYIRPVVVPGAGHKFQSDTADVVVGEALKAVAELEVAFMKRRIVALFG